MEILTFVYLRSLLRLRRRLKQRFPSATEQVVARVDPVHRLNAWLFSRWFVELNSLRDACLFHPEAFPTKVLGDDAVFENVLKVRKGMVTQIWVALGWIALGALR